MHAMQAPDMQEVLGDCREDVECGRQAVCDEYGGCILHRASGHVTPFMRVEHVLQGGD